MVKQFREYPVRLGDRGMRTTPMIGSTPNALNLPRVHFDPKLKPEQYMADISANFAAIQRVVNNLPVPTVGTGFLDSVDGWVIRVSGSGGYILEVDEVLRDNDYDVKTGDWHISANGTLTNDLPDNVTGGQLITHASFRFPSQDTSTFGSEQGSWTGEHDRGWYAPKFQTPPIGFGDVSDINTFLSGVATMTSDDTTTEVFMSGEFWVLDDPGVEYDDTEMGQSATTKIPADWSLVVIGYRLDDFEYNPQTDEWPYIEL